jgi:putative serine protease PepD
MNRPARDKNERRWLPWAAAGASLVFLGVVGGIIAAVSNQSPSSASTEAGSSPSTCDVTTVAAQDLPSVVTISAKGSAGAGTGSGEVIDNDGHIMTNNHVIAVAANGGSVAVEFYNGTTAPATIVGRDALTDLAVLKVAASQSPPPISLGSSSSVEVGQGVVVLGAPLGLSNTVTSGIVSALDRTIQVPAENDKTALLVSAVQTDAAINPGNSGGAMVNCSGQLIGVPTAGATVPSSSGESSGGSIGLGFAIPVDLAKTITSEIISTGRASHAFFGISTVPTPGTAAEGQTAQGLLVRQVVPGGPSATAGLLAGDIITSLGGEAATSNVQLQEITLTSKPGDKVDVGYTRNGRSATTAVTLGTQPLPVADRDRGQLPERRP